MMEHMVAYNLAIDLVKKAGFILDHVAMQSETCYFRHPSIKKGRLLRVSTHRGKGRIGHNGVVSKVTCGVRDMHLSPTSVENQVIYAIGRYFLTQPKPSEYRGKRGTWERPELLTPGPVATAPRETRCCLCGMPLGVHYAVVWDLPRVGFAHLECTEGMEPINPGNHRDAAQPEGIFGAK